jgi:hypothetical protein
MSEGEFETLNEVLAERRRLRAELAALKSAAWDVYEVVTDAMDNPEDNYTNRIAFALDAMGELLPASRPEVNNA